MAPTFFAVYFAVVIREIKIDKGVFDISRLQYPLQQIFILQILYADDMCLISDSMAQLQGYVDAPHQSRQRFGLFISSSKTQILKQPPPGCEADKTVLNLDGKLLEEVIQVNYLGTNIRLDNN